MTDIVLVSARVVAHDRVKILRNRYVVFSFLVGFLEFEFTSLLFPIGEYIANFIYCYFLLIK